MNLRHPRFRQLACHLLASILTLQPVFAAEYRIPLQGLHPTNSTSGTPGSGAGSVQVDDAPVQLQLSTTTLRFEVQDGVTPSAQKVLLMNAGFRPATLTPIQGNADFMVSHDCPAALAPASSCTITVTPTTTLPNAQYSLAIGAAEVTGPVAVQLTTVSPSTGIAPHLQVSESPVYLGNLSPGQSASATARLTNAGNFPATLKGLASQGDFTITSDCPAQLDPKAFCTVTATFSSYVPKTHSLTLQVNAAELPDSNATPLTYYADVHTDPTLVPALALSPSTLQFDTLDVGASATKTATLTNQGTVPAELSGFVSDADFDVRQACPATLAVGASCPVQVLFTALKAGTAPAYDLVIKAQANVSAYLFLQGAAAGTSAAPAPVFSPNSLSFAAQPVGQSTTQTATLSNPTGTAMSLKGLSIDFGADAFTQSNDCGATLAAQASCTVSVTFTPSTPASRDGRVRVDTASGATAALTVHGTGQQAVLTVSPATLNLGAMGWPASPASRSVSIINSGNIPLTGLSFDNRDPHLSLDATNCTTTLKASESCSLSLRYTPGGLGVISSSMRVLSDAAGTATIELSGAVVQLTASPASLSFEDTNVGQSSSDQAITLSNQGPDAVPLDGISIAAGDYQQANTCGTSVAAGSSCLVAVRFAPTSQGPSTGSLSVAAYGAGLFNVPLSGTGLPTWLSLSQTSVTFPPGYIQQPSKPVDVTLTNPTRTPVSITGMGITSGESVFGQSNNCGTSLAAGASCTVTLQATPTAAAAVQGTWSAVTAIGTYYVELSGQGKDAAASVSPTSVDFGMVGVGQRVTKSVTVSNPGAVAMSLQSVAANPSTFAQTNDCGAAIAPGASCTVSISFVPTDTVASAGTLRVLTSTGQTSDVGLSGTGQGTGFALSTTNVDFGNILYPGATPVSSVTLTNNGNIAVTGLSYTPSDPALAVNSSDCSGSLAQNQSCTLKLQYTPHASGAFTGSLQITSANAGAATVAVSGRAVGIAASPTALQFPTTWANDSAPDQSVTVSNTGTDTLVFDGLGVTAGMASFNQSNNCGTNLAAGASCTVTVRFTPTGGGAVQGELTAVTYGSPMLSVLLNGTGLDRKLTLSTDSVSFAPTNVGQPSPAVNVTLANPTNKAVAITGASIVTDSSEFAQSNNCGTSLDAGASCTVTLQMTPASTNGSRGTWTVVSALGNYSLSLTGQGTQPVADIAPDTQAGVSDPAPATGTADGFTHYTISFLATEYGQVSAVRNVKFSNKGTGPLAIQGISLADGLNDFLMSNNCGSVLQPGQYCTVSLQFKPSQRGARTGGVALLSDTGNYYFDLGGSGIAAVGSLTADTSTDFGMVDTGTSVLRSFTFKNTGDAPVRDLVTAVTGSGLSLLGNGCGVTGAPAIVSAGATCTVTVKYTSPGPGTLTGASLQMAGTLINGSQHLDLSGSTPTPALAFDATPSGDFGTVQLGSASSRTFVLRNTGKFLDTVSGTPAVSGSGFSYGGGTCAQTSLAADSTCTVIVTVNPAAAGTVPGSISATSTKGASTSLGLSVTGQAKTPTLGTWTVASQAVGSAPFKLTPPTSDSPGLFTYSSDNPAVATVSGNTVTVIGAGTANLTATQQASGIYGTASKTATFTVAKGTPVITFTVPAQSYAYNPLRISPLTLAATSTSPGALTYATSLPSAKLTVAGTTATFNATGTFTITVSQAATADYVAGTTTATFDVTAPGGALVVAGRAWTPKSSAAMTWDNASAGCAASTTGGSAGWRLGTVTELKALASADNSVRPNWPYMWADGGTSTSRTGVNVGGGGGTLVMAGTTGSVFQSCTRE